MTDKQNTCCIVRRRNVKFPFIYDEAGDNCLRLKISLAVEIEAMRARGVTAFITSLAQDVELWAAEIILDLKRSYPETLTRLTVRLPCEGQENRLPEELRGRYAYILSAADEVKALSKQYVKGCLSASVRAMADASAHMIAVCSGSESSAKCAVNYALNAGLDVVIINPDGLQ